MLEGNHKRSVMVGIMSCKSAVLWWSVWLSAMQVTDGFIQCQSCFDLRSDGLVLQSKRIPHKVSDPPTIMEVASRSTALFSSPSGNDKKEGESTPAVYEQTELESRNDRDDLGWFLRGALSNRPSSSSIPASDTSAAVSLQVGSFVVAKADIPKLGIWIDQAYELKEVYVQSTNEDGTINRRSMDGIDASSNDSSSRRQQQYIRLYSPMYHKDTGPVIVTPEEVGLVTFQQEVRDSIIFALPVLGFWLSVSYVFVTKYTERSGGTILDAFLGK